MTGGAKRVYVLKSVSVLTCHPFLRAGEHIRAGAHRATDQDWLASELVIHWNQRVVRRECARCALSMDA